MGRGRLFTEAEFRAAYHSCESMQDLVAKLNTSNITVYKYLKRLKLPLYSTGPNGWGKKPVKALEIYNAYKDRVTVKDLCLQFGMSNTAINYNLVAAMRWLRKQPDPLPYAQPRSLSQIKVLHAITEAEPLMDDPDGIAAATGVRMSVIKDYLDMNYKHMTTVTPPRRGRRAKTGT